ncbi:MAG TPA: dUTP diphosphatase [Candidatus Coproplasma avistercoris]|nr:dUTP diphosphatase [Candidatus Coproplasma avistercoris]
MNVAIKKLNKNAKLPAYGSEYAAGADLYACLDMPVVIAPGRTKVIPTGIALELPVGYAGLIYARSGLATKQGLAPANKVGVVDCDYRGEVMVALHNHSGEARTVNSGDRIAQLVITPYITAVFEEKKELSPTARGAGGFGSTGTK